MQFTIYFIIFLLSVITLFELLRIGRRFVIAKKLGKETEAVSQSNQEASQHILIIGDSTAFGTGAHQKENSLAGRLARDYPNASIDNFSENGMGIKRLLEKISAIKDRKYDIILIHIGGIDVLSLTPQTQVIEKTNAVLDQALTLLKKGKAKKLILVSMNNVGSAPAFRFPVNKMLAHRSRKFCAMFGEICKERKITHVALFEEKSNDPLAQRSAVLYAKDGIHPNDDGYAIWYNKIKEALKN